MNNKKTIARIFALLFAMTLVVALALPCFAFETEEEIQALTNNFLEYYGLDGSLASALASTIPIEDFMSYEYLYTTVYTVDYNKPFSGSYYLFYGADMSQGNMYIDCDVDSLALEVGTECQFLYGTNLSYEWVSENYITFLIYSDEMEVLQYRWEYNQETGEYLLSDAFYNGVELPNNTSVAFACGGNSVSLQNEFINACCDISVRYSPLNFTEGAFVYCNGNTTEDVPDGMYGQLYSILRSSLFGNGTLTPDQQFTLTQTAMWLSWAVILVPVIICVCITVKLLRF